MKKIALSLASIMTVTTLSAGTDGVNTNLNHGKDAKKLVESKKSVDDLSSMFSEGVTSGQVRFFYVDRNYAGFSDTHRNSTAVGGHVKYETAAFKGLNFASAFYTTNNISALDYTDNNGGDGKKDPSLLGTGYDSYIVFGELYLNYDMSDLGTKTSARLGYQRYDTPMIGSDDARMLPNTFEAYKFVNTDVTGLNLQVAHVNAIAYGTFGNIYTIDTSTGTVKAGGILGATSGYAVNGAPTGSYINMGQAAVGKDTAGITNIQASYKLDNFQVKLSNDYAWDLYNTLYVDGGISWDCLLNSDIHPFVKAQVIKQNSVGGSYMQDSSLGGTGEVDSLYGAAKVGAKYAGFTAYVAYSQTSANSSTDDSYKNAIVSQFGGMPAFTQGMVTRHQFLAGTKSTKVAASYSFKELGTNLSVATYYASFDMDENSGYGGARTATEPGFDVKYYPASVKNLELRFRGNFPREFAQNAAGEALGWDEYRLIANYNFSTK